MKNSKLYHLVLIMVSGICIALSFAPYDIIIALPLGFVALFILHDNIINRSTWAYFGAFFCAFNTAMVLGTWWVKNAALAGLIAGSIANSLYMTLPFLALRYAHNRNLGRLSWALFISAWLGVEYIHLNHNDFDFPWLMLGNAFANHTYLIQWYEFTGVAGGSAWVLIVGVLLHLTIKTPSKTLAFYTALAIFLPIISSLIISNSIKFTGTKCEVVVLQPNIDPYGQKFNPIYFQQQLARFLTLSDSASSNKTQLLLWPETAIPGNIYIGHDSYQLQQIYQYTALHNEQLFVTGASAIATYQDSATATCRRFANGQYYDAYNAALGFVNQDTMQVYYKSKLVIGVEKMPLIGSVPFLKTLVLDMGGTTGQLGTQPQRSLITHKGIKAAPVICYESIFGNYVTQYVRQGANIITIITNDAWWGNTPGYKQHLSYARLRAIENRRFIARSANTGISAFIDAKGNIYEHTEYNKETALRNEVYLQDQLTFYTIHGDFIGRAAIVIFMLLLVLLMLKPKSPQF